MGYPMNYQRVLKRNGLTGDYETSMIAGDLRRLEQDQRDEQHLAMYGRLTGLTPEQCKSVLDALFEAPDTWPLDAKLAASGAE